MIVPRLEGGLGNQMFQIAAAVGASCKHFRDYGINFDLPHSCIQGHPPTKYKDNLFNTIPTTDIVPQTFHKEPHFQYHPIPHSDQDVLIWGYFQSDKYFEGFNEEIKRLFTFPEDVVKKIDDRLEQIDKQLVGVHVRRGDYLRFPTIHPTCSVEYYKEAFSKFDDCNFIVTSDDIPWCEQNLDGDNVIFSNCVSELEDMYLLSQCNNSILSNGSFAWWGCYLGKDKEKVVAPSAWFGPDGPHDYRDVYREGWIQI